MRPSQEARELAEAERQRLLADAEKVDQRAARQEAPQRHATRSGKRHCARCEQKCEHPRWPSWPSACCAKPAGTSLRQQLATQLVETLKHSCPKPSEHRCAATGTTADGAVVETAQPRWMQRLLRRNHRRPPAPSSVAGEARRRDAPGSGGRRSAAHRRPRVGCSLAGQLTRSQAARCGGGSRQQCLTPVEQLVEQLRQGLGRHPLGGPPARGWLDRAAWATASPICAAVLRCATASCWNADGLTALAFDLRRDEVGVLFLDPCDHVGAGDELRATGRVASVW